MSDLKVETKMRKLITGFARDEDGAVTVDWVVLTAAIVGLGVGVIAMVSNGATNHAESVGNKLDSLSISTY